MDSLKLDYLELELKNGANVNEMEPEFNLNFLQKCIIDEFSLQGKDGEEFAKMVQLLLDNGIDVNHQDVDGCTALHFAIGEEQYELAKILLKNGANPAIVDKRGETAFDDLTNLVGADPLKFDQRQEILLFLRPN
jgi:ankyrin repeat protein